MLEKTLGSLVSGNFTFWSLKLSTVYKHWQPDICVTGLTGFIYLFIGSVDMFPLMHDYLGNKTILLGKYK